MYMYRTLCITTTANTFELLSSWHPLQNYVISTIKATDKHCISLVKSPGTLKGKFNIEDSL